MNRDETARFLARSTQGQGHNPVRILELARVEKSTGGAWVQGWVWVDEHQMYAFEKAREKAGNKD